MHGQQNVKKSECQVFINVINDTDDKLAILFLTGNEN
jgi:hypothetical protein